ncbi:hypothetical protein D5S17_26590 [Pseudonocardiaceae bacterium YIM PH 21723]|nr:hypothetical protein D5S17_26590 [Pseudonocardiaceae bacterium YIM PH 21723]
MSIWHCDALGYYSGHLSQDPDVEAPIVPHREPDDASRFLRGIQVSDKNGCVRFSTIYPGWYFGRTIHIHVKVWIAGKTVHTGQLYFADELTDQVALTAPYNTHDFPRLKNADDGIYKQQGGPRSHLLIKPAADKSLDGSITLGLNA